MIRAYYYLTKPGIIYGNAMTALAGFLLATQGRIDWLQMLAMLLGISLVIGSSCAFNNYIDRDIDSKMARTKSRALVKGEISGRGALIFASVLGVLGMIILSWFTNFLTLLIAFVGAVVYVLLYTPMKRQSLYGTLIGSISGATPIAAGYCAVTNLFDTGALMLFLIMVIWQMPHFYAIAIHRLQDYAAAKVPVLPIQKGIRVAKIHIVAYVFAYLVAALSLSFFGVAGYTYAAVMGITSLVWLWFGFDGFRRGVDDFKWASKMFFFSLVVLLVFSAAISVDVFLP